MHHKKRSFLAREDHLRVIAHRVYVFGSDFLHINTIRLSGKKLPAIFQTDTIICCHIWLVLFFHGWKPYINLLLNHTLHSRKSYSPFIPESNCFFFGTRSTICFYFRVKHFSYTFLTTEQQIGIRTCIFK